MKKWFNLTIWSIFLLCPVVSFAAPAYPGLVTMKQPDGEEISVYLRGDETVHWMESPDGYSLLFDNNKRIVFATTDDAGNMIPSSIVFQNESLRSSTPDGQSANIRKGLRYSASQISALKEIRNLRNSIIKDASLRSSTGATIHAVCTLVEFPDQPLTKTIDDFNQLMNQSGYNSDGARGSVHDFFYEDSYGKLDLEITMVGPFKAAKNLSYYGQNNGANTDVNVQELAQDVANYTFGQSGINPAEFDNDGDGNIDAFHFIYAGYGEEAGGSPSTIWAHESDFFITLNFGGKKLNTYSCSPELRGNLGTGITRIGVICHEMGHIFGSPDYYDVDEDTGGNFLGTGRWDLMSNGSWNGPANDGASPAHTNMFQKIRLGWVTPVTLSTPQPVTNMPNSAENAIAYTYNTSVSGEYYVLENRQQTGFDSYVPGHGLLIYHVSVKNSDISNNLVNNTYPQKMYPVCASSTYKIPNSDPASYGDINSAGCPFPGTAGNKSFTDYTTPSAITWNGANSAKPVTEINESGGTISFNFMQPGAESVLNFTLTRSGNNVQLNWDQPNTNVLGYNIYRNNQLIIRLMGSGNTSYTQNNVSPGDFTYCVTAFYDQEESDSSCQSINIPGTPNAYPVVRNLQQTTDGNIVKLTWDSPVQSDTVNLPDKYSVYRNNMWLNDVYTGPYLDIVPANGNFTYCVSAVYGGNVSEQVCVQTTIGDGTGIIELHPSEGMKIYPNPIKQGDVLTLDTGNDFTGAKLSFYSVSGQLLREAAISEPGYRLKIDLAPGIYVLQIRKNMQIITRKIVVN